MKVIHRGNRTEILLNDAGIVLKRLLPFADVSTERQALDDERTMQELAAGDGVVPVLPKGASESELCRHFVAGSSLHELTRPVERAPEIALDLAKIVERVHALTTPLGRPLQLIHRDITPGNVLLGDDGRVWLNDFGLAHTPLDGPLPVDQTLQGTRRFLAPELANGAQPSQASDVYQVALLLAYLVAEDERPPVDLAEREAWAYPLLAPFEWGEAVLEDPGQRPPIAALVERLRRHLAHRQ